MIKTFVFCLALLYFKANAVIQVPFIGIYGEYDMHFNISVGTPRQDLRIRFHDDWEMPDLYLTDARTYNTGFNPDKSSTFVNMGTSRDTEGENGINGTDIITINGVDLKQKPMKVINQLSDKRNLLFGRMGVTRHDGFSIDYPNRRGGCTSFLQSVLADQEENSLVVAFDNITPKDARTYSGHIVFGNKAPELCQPDYAYMPEVKNKEQDYAQWTFDVDKISTGKYSFPSPGQAQISFQFEELFLPQQLYMQIMKALGSTDMDTIPCNNKNDIVLQMGGKELRIPPKVFMFDQKPDGMCGTWLINWAYKTMYIPATAFSNYCILLDYDKIQVGYAQRVQN